MCDLSSRISAKELQLENGVIAAKDAMQHRNPLS